MNDLAGDAGALAASFCYALKELSAKNPSYQSWRFLGLIDSAGGVGRLARCEQLLFAAWVRVKLGRKEGYAVWLESQASKGRGEIQCSQSQLQVDTEWGLLPMRLVELAESELTIREIEALELGDVVLLNPTSEIVRMRLGTRVLVGEETLQGVNLVRMEHTLEDEIMEELNIPPLTDESDGIEPSNLPVVVVAEIGRLEMNVGQVSRLALGTVLTLPDAVLGPVDLRVCGRLIARGEMVNVEGRRGVRLSEICWKQKRSSDAQPS
jgi:flagellar motor switch protein FliN/FliY